METNIDARGAQPGVGTEIRAAIEQAKHEAAAMGVAQVLRIQRSRGPYDNHPSVFSAYRAGLEAQTARTVHFPWA